jgi:hypothetical protein
MPILWEEADGRTYGAALVPVETGWTQIIYRIDWLGQPTDLRVQLDYQRAAYLQTLEQLNGLTLFIDEAHTTPEPRDLEHLVYQFANGQSYTIGTPERQTRGGTPLGGTLLIAGEAIVDIQHAGARG